MEIFYNAVGKLSAPITNVLSKISNENAKNITEVRLRSNRCIQIITPFKNYWLENNGHLKEDITPNSFIVSHEMIKDSFYTLCGFSAHSYENSIKNGFITLSQGHRVGISGTAVCSNGRLDTIKNITSLNLRIARSNIMSVPYEIRKTLSLDSGGLFIVGPPSSGKTTLIRAISKFLSDSSLKVAVADERFEIFPVEVDGFCTSVPSGVDVLSGYPKNIAMEQAVRCLSPDVIICDEIGSEEDINSLIACINTGVRVIATAHGDSINSLLKRPHLKEILTTGAFSNVAILSNEGIPGQLKEVKKINVDN